MKVAMSATPLIVSMRHLGLEIRSWLGGRSLVYVFGDLADYERKQREKEREFAERVEEDEARLERERIDELRAFEQVEWKNPLPLALAPYATIVFLAVFGLWFEGETADHRDAAQWDFYVVPALSLPEGQRTISLSKIKKLARPVPITGLGEEIDRVRVSPSS